MFGKSEDAANAAGVRSANTYEAARQAQNNVQSQYYYAESLSFQPSDTTGGVIPDTNYNSGPGGEWVFFGVVGLIGLLWAANSVPWKTVALTGSNIASMLSGILAAFGFLALSWRYPASASAALLSAAAASLIGYYTLPQSFVSLLLIPGGLFLLIAGVGALLEKSLHDRLYVQTRRVWRYFLALLGALALAASILGIRFRKEKLFALANDVKPDAIYIASMLAMVAFVVAIIAFRMTAPPLSQTRNRWPSKVALVFISLLFPFATILATIPLSR